MNGLYHWKIEYFQTHKKNEKVCLGQTSQKANRGTQQHELKEDS